MNTYNKCLTFLLIVINQLKKRVKKSRMKQTERTTKQL